MTSDISLGKGMRGAGEACYLSVVFVTYSLFGKPRFSREDAEVLPIVTYCSGFQLFFSYIGKTETIGNNT